MLLEGLEYLEGLYILGWRLYLEVLYILLNLLILGLL